MWNSQLICHITYHHLGARLLVIFLDVMPGIFVSKFFFVLRSDPCLGWSWVSWAAFGGAKHVGFYKPFLADLKGFLKLATWPPVFTAIGSTFLASVTFTLLLWTILLSLALFSEKLLTGTSLYFFSVLLLENHDGLAAAICDFCFILSFWAESSRRRLWRLIES